MKITTTLLFVLFVGIITSHAQSYQWAKRIGGTFEDLGRSIAVDSYGSVYTTGSFTGTVDFDPGAGTYNLTSVGSVGAYDIFITKLDSAGNFIWAKSIGGISGERGYSIAVDDSFNVYITGNFWGTVDFDPGAGINNLTSVGQSDIYITKLDAAGNFLWAKSMGGIGNNLGLSIAVDGSGNVYTTGYFQGTADFDPGAGTSNLNSAGSEDIFISKLDSAGNFLWAKSMGGTSYDWGLSIAVDGSGNVYTTGVFQGTVDFDPGVGTSNLTSAGLGDIFISKLDSAGNFLWAKRIGWTSNDWGNSISVDGYGNVFTTGSFLGTADFDPGAGIYNLTSAGWADIFILKLDSLGNYIWAKRMGGTDSDLAYSIAVDDSGNVYTTGTFYGTADFDPAVGTNNLTSMGLNDIFISKLDSAGNFLWAKSMGGTNHDIGQSIAVDGSGNVYTTGHFRGSADFDPGVGTSNLISEGEEDIFISKYIPCINTLGLDLVTACDSYIWIDGNTYTASNSTATHTLINMAGCDSVIALNLTINNSTTGTDVQTACNTFTWIDGNAYTANNNTATHTLTNVVGCDSVVTLNLTINSNTGTDVQTACNTFTWIDGNTYTATNNTATHTLTNAAGCDSVVTLNLTINSNTGTDVQTACSTFTWIDGNTYTASNSTATHTLTNAAGCDSVVALNLTINNSTIGTDVQSACNSYLWIDGNTYTTSNNTATHTLTNVAGCDSIVTLDLTIIGISDLTTSTSGETITANNTSATYQWLDCGNNYAAIAGATGQTFTATANGNYAVELTENGCVDTSACVAITTVGILENSYGNALRIYPNPTQGEFSIDLGTSYDEVTVIIRNLLGQEVLRKSFGGSSVLQLNIPGEAGMYLIELSSGDKKAIVKVVKE